MNNDLITSLNDRDDVEKTEYTRRRVDEGEVRIEMWHDTESLQRIAERAITGVPLSQKGMENLARDEALVVRETRVQNVPIEMLYPDVAETISKEP